MIILTFEKFCEQKICTYAPAFLALLIILLRDVNKLISTFQSFSSLNVQLEIQVLNGLYFLITMSIGLELVSKSWTLTLYWTLTLMSMYQMSHNRRYFS